MFVQVPHLPGDISNLNVVYYVVTGIVVVVVRTKRPNLDAIPTVGSSTWLGSWWAGFKFTINGAKVIQEGYDKYKSRPFKVADYYRWMVIVSSREHIDELRGASDDEFSFMEAINDRLHLEHTVGTRIQRNPYHVALILSKLARNIGALYAETKDEIDNALEEILDLRGNEWKTVTALDLVQKVIFRTTNRAFVGLPLCRNLDWMSLNIRYVFDVVAGGILLELTPAILAPFVARFLTFVPRTTRQGMKLLGPIIDERQKHLDEWTDKPNDFLSWMKQRVRNETSSNVRPVHDIRSPKHERPLLACLSRKAMKDYTFSDGTFIPKGTMIAVASRCLHLDDEFYDNAVAFDPFRFANMRETDGEGTKHQFVSTGVDYLPFGYGRLACPGRFFASNVLASILAQVVFAYDVKLEKAALPDTVNIGTSVLANPKAKVVFRRRVH